MQDLERMTRVCKSYCDIKGGTLPKNEKEIEALFKKAKKEMIFIYFDMDGVLANFDLGVKEILNMEPIKQEHQDPQKSNEIFSAIQEKIAQGIYFYRELKPIGEVINIFKDLHGLYGDFVQILTGIPREDKGIKNAKENKEEWVKQHLGDDIIVNAVTRKEKVNYCYNEDCILIDDYTANIENWKKTGGIGILYRNTSDLKRQLCELLDFINYSEGDISVHYDNAADTLYIDYLSKWQNAIVDNQLDCYGDQFDKNNDFVILRNSSNDEIIGYVVMNYKKHLKNKKITKFPWKNLNFEKDLLPIIDNYFKEVDNYIKE